MRFRAPLYLLRHGETAWNTERRMQGLRNSDLTERGRAQAIAMGRALKAELDRAPGPTVFLKSPLGRTRETALLIGRELCLDPAAWREEPRLAELGYGDWEGSSWAEIEAHTPNALADWKADPEAYCPPNGESHTQLRARMASLLEEIAASSVRTVAVGHGVSGAVMRGLHLRLDARAMFVLEKPQDAFFRLDANGEQRILADVAAEATNDPKR